MPDAGLMLGSERPQKKPGPGPPQRPDPSGRRQTGKEGQHREPLSVALGGAEQLSSLVESVRIHLPLCDHGKLLSISERQFPYP